MRRPVQNRLDAGRELGEAERLCHVVVGSRGKATQDLEFVAARGQHDDGYLGSRPEAAENLPPVEPGHRHVQQHDVRRDVGKDATRLLPVGDPDDAIAESSQVVGEQFEKRRVIVHDHDGCHFEAA